MPAHRTSGLDKLAAFAALAADPKADRDEELTADTIKDRMVELVLEPSTSAGDPGAR